MAINPLLLIAAPILQDYLVDVSTGLPLAGGIITLYQDASRTTFKNWYYQSGSPGAYTYITLPNPLTLSAAGTIVDNNGNDTIPFFYPFSEADNITPQPYYIVVTNSNGQQQFVRQNFPYNPEPPEVLSNPTQRNYLVNNVFWQNVGSVNATNLTSVTLAPSQHDGFSMPDIQFLKSVTGATDTLTFTKFTPGDAAGQVLQNDITPEFYFNLNCSASQAGETQKCMQIPISLHVKTLENVEASIVIHAQNVAGNTNNTLTLAINQFLGTGVSASSPIVIQTLTLSNNWTKYVIPFTFPTAAGLTLSAAGDDALYLQIGFPLAVTCNINIAKPQIYLSEEVPNNDFDTYDEIDAVINSPRTGDFKHTISNFNNFGWVQLNDGTIGDNTSGASYITSSNGSNNTWPLYNLLWSSVNNTFAPVSSGRGASAYADYTAHKTIGLTKVLGRLLMGLPTSSTFTYANGTGIYTVASNAYFYVGSPVYITNTGGAIPSGLALNTIYYAIPIAGSTTTLKVATSYANAIAGTAFVPASDNGSGTNTLNFALSGSFGEAEHTQLTAELATHSHNATGGNQFVNTGVGGNNYGTGAFTTGTEGATATTGSSTPFNVINPVSYVNILMKL